MFDARPNSVAGFIVGCCVVFASKGETLHNGIVLPDVWPPRDVSVATPSAAREPMPVPYLENRPSVVPIDVGRQLFVDDFLIERTDLARVYGHPVKFDGNPVLCPETADEINAPQNACALPKGGGLWWDAARGVFRLWYEMGWCHVIGVAESADGVSWRRVCRAELPDGLKPDSWSVLPDPGCADPSRRWKMFLRSPGPSKPADLLASPDGIRWTKICETGACGDRSSAFCNPFRRKWVLSLRSFWGEWGKGGFRSRHYCEADDFFGFGTWERKMDAPSGPCVPWAGPDRLDAEDAENKFPVQLYNLDAVAYESVMLGAFELLLGPENGDCAKRGLPKITDVCFAYSRDGFHWSRPDRTAAIASSRWNSHRWDAGYVQPLANLCVVKGDELWFYYGAFAGDTTRLGTEDNGMYCNGAMGLAKMRRDGFAGLRAASRRGSLVTRPVRFSGRRLFVNVAAPRGSLSVDVLDVAGRPLAKVGVVSGDSTKLAVGDVAAFSGRDVRLKFDLESGVLYSFWASDDDAGRSRGYLAGGGPGYSGLRDE